MTDHAAKVVHEMRSVHADKLRQQRESYREELATLAADHQREKRELEEALAAAREKAAEVEKICLPLPRRSMYIFRGRARYSLQPGYTHGLEWPAKRAAPPPPKPVAEKKGKKGKKGKGGGSPPRSKSPKGKKGKGKPPKVSTMAH